MLRVKTFYISAIAAFLLLFPALSTAVKPHDTGSISECMSCHEFDSTGYGILPAPTGAAQEAMCKTCHSLGGEAAGMRDIANHVVNGGATVIACSSCHDPHVPNTSIDPHPGGQTAENLKLIRNAVKYVNGALLPAVFQQSPAHFAFDSTPYIGICQTCHTQTDYHRNDGTGISHEAGTQCTNCHTHINGFIAASE